MDTLKNESAVSQMLLVVYLFKVYLGNSHLYNIFSRQKLKVCECVCGQ